MKTNKQDRNIHHRNIQNRSIQTRSIQTRSIRTLFLAAAVFASGSALAVVAEQPQTPGSPTPVSLFSNSLTLRVAEVPGYQFAYTEPNNPFQVSPVTFENGLYSFTVLIGVPHFEPPPIGGGISEGGLVNNPGPRAPTLPPMNTEEPPVITMVYPSPGLTLNSFSVSETPAYDYLPATFHLQTLGTGSFSGPGTAGAGSWIDFGAPGRQQVTIGEFGTVDAGGQYAVTLIAADFRVWLPTDAIGAPYPFLTMEGSLRYNSSTAPYLYLAAVPEPEQYLMLLAGLGVVAARLRRRRSAQA